MSPVSRTPQERADALRDLTAARDRISGAAKRADTATQILVAAREQLKAARHPGHRADHQAAVADNTVILETAHLDLNAGRVAFDAFSDPRDNVDLLDDGTPLLLFPVRLETRFRRVRAGAVEKDQLWVRVYPDECVVDTFEPIPSENEIANVQKYWALMWRARTDEAQERGAWRTLVAAHGSGRATWLLANYTPLNTAEKPTDPSPTVLVLIIPTETPLGTTEADAVLAFWPAIWQANGDATATAAAFSTLSTAVNGDDRARVLMRDYAPMNLGDTPPAGTPRPAMTVSAVFITFPNTADLVARLQSWSQPARARVLPDRFVLIGIANGTPVIEEIGRQIPWPLHTSPDPHAPAHEQIRQETGELIVGDDLRWLVDFDRAVDVGMGFRVDLPADLAAAGLDRLLVVGLRLSADAQEGKRLLEELLRHHRDGTAGLTILRQGTPTNNTEETDAGYTRGDDPDASFDERLHPGPALRADTAPETRVDGEWLGNALGVDPAIFNAVPGSRATDHLEAAAMNVALWPATLGYGLETLLHPIFESADIERVRWFFTEFVSGRGWLPTVRIGRQPYGVLPASAWSRLQWPLKDPRPSSGVSSVVAGPREGPHRMLARLYYVLTAMDADWIALAKQAPHVGAGGDPHQLLLRILALHPTSVEYYQRFAESLEDLYNRMRLTGSATDFMRGLESGIEASRAMDLLRRLSYDGNASPDALQQLLFSRANLLNGPLIEDAPLSETGGLHASTDDPWNYLEWLRDAASRSLDALREERGFTGNKPPKAVLYLLARHALLQSYWDASLKLGEERGVMTPETVKAARHESPFIHVQTEPRGGESRWGTLYAYDAQITGDPAVRVGDFITGAIGAEPATSRLSEMLAAIDSLSGLPTARLERLLAEHIDTCSYRLDAWQQGFLHYALAQMRGQGAAVRDGVFLGAFGWLEDVRPKVRTLDPVVLPAGVDGSFQPVGAPPLVHDSTNGGYIHAPSLNQAVAAAVLRNGYLANATPASPGAFAVNLSSRRVRAAIAILEGLRQGQSLGALLGYQFERGLHDNHALAEVDTFIYALRKRFPLRADRHPDTRTDEDVPIEAIEARNVVDGLRLVEHVKGRASVAYPFGLTLPAANQNERDAIDAEVIRLLDTADAVADVKIADSVYHAVQGNYDAVAATLDSSASGQLPTAPAIVATPRSGRGVVHRMALHLASGLNEDQSAIVGMAVTPRALAEPALNQWLAGVLPAPDAVVCTVTWFDTATNGLRTQTVTQTQLGLQPIDLLYVASLESQQALTELDDRVLLYAHRNLVSRPDSQVSIAYSTPVAGKVTFFELAPLLRSLRTLALHSRPLRPSDASPQGSASTSMDALVRIKPARITKVRTALTAVFTDVRTYRDSLRAQHDDATRRGEILAEIDQRLDDFVALLVRAASFGVPQGAWGFALDARRALFVDLLEGVRALVERSTRRLADCDARLAVYDAAAGLTEEEKYTRLTAAELCVRARATVPARPPAPAATYRTDVGAARDVFAARLADFAAVLAINTKSVVTLRTAIATALAGPPALATLDREPFAPSDVDERVVALSADLLARATRLASDLDKRQLTPVTDLMTKHDAAADDAVRARLLGEAAKLLLGPDAVVIPEFQLDAAAGQALQAAYDAAAVGDPLTHQQTVLRTPLPVDTWLYGVARVREKVQQWERATVLCGAFGAASPDLLPVQIPWKAGDHWLAMELPAGYAPDGDRLCYTTHFATPYDRTRWQCGLLLDEWTEVIPGSEETTGLAFHFDRPNAEPPQVLLLVTPASFTGAWRWPDIVDAVVETFERAKRRAVEPEQIEALPYARFLPMTVMATALHQISIVTNLGRNNDVYAFVEGATDNG